jgi:uncharacterized membrane protein
MESKTSLTLRGVRVLFFSILLFASFTASLYFPHQTAWWRIAMILTVAFNVWGLVSSYRQRAVRRREEQL